MVVVLDAIESEKTELDYEGDDIVNVSRPLVGHSTRPANPGKSRPRWRLSRKGQWVLRSVSALVIGLVVLGNWIGAEEDSNDFQLLSSIIEGSSSDNDLGCLGIMLQPENVEKHFLSVSKALVQLSQTSFLSSG